MSGILATMSFWMDSDGYPDRLLSIPNPSIINELRISSRFDLQSWHQPPNLVTLYSIHTYTPSDWTSYTAPASAVTRGLPQASGIQSDVSLSVYSGAGDILSVAGTIGYAIASWAIVGDGEAIWREFVDEVRFVSTGHILIVRDELSGPQADTLKMSVTVNIES